jgi:ABC-type multidrug transport system fused ATPase/permease subunit
VNNTTTYLIIVVAALVLVALYILVRSRRKHSERLHDQLGPEYDRTVQAMGGAKKAQTELEERRKRVEALNIHPLSASERERYLADWTAVQSKFVDEPGQAIVDADSLIMQVMQSRAYPVSDFEQRAADISVTYPALVSNYRAAREIAVRNEQHQADTEELRQAMIHYRSLFEELLGTEPVVGKET